MVSVFTQEEASKAISKANCALLVLFEEAIETADVLAHADLGPTASGAVFELNHVRKHCSSKKNYGRHEGQKKHLFICFEVKKVCNLLR